VSLPAADPAPTIPFHRPSLPDVEGFLEDARGILESGWQSDGRHVRDLEAAIAALAGAANGIAISNCSDGLIAALRAVARPGAEVIIPSFTYLATWSSVVWAGMVPVVVDVDRHGIMDPAAVSDALTPRTGAVLAVHLTGAPAPMGALRDLLAGSEIALVADAAHALGAVHADGRPVGSVGDVEVFSTGATKQLAAGEGGVIVTSSAPLADWIARFARQGHQPGSMNATMLGMNLRLPELSAALALRQLPGLEAQLARRTDVAHRYRLAWADLPLTLSGPAAGERSAYKDQLVWVDRADDREPLRRHLAARGIETRPYYECAVPDIAAFEGIVASAEVGRDLATRSFGVPIHPRLTDDDVVRVTVAVREHFAGRS
jgi:perosamine synthetase